MHYDDLSPMNDLAPGLTAIGWLEQGHAYKKGDISPAIFSKLKALVTELSQAPQLLPMAAGVHTCDLCQYDGPSGYLNLLVPGDGLLYVMPELAVHYVAAHRYLPPDEFGQAVLACPSLLSMEYKRAILTHGGRALLESMSNPRTAPDTRRDRADRPERQGELDW